MARLFLPMKPSGPPPGRHAEQERWYFRARAVQSRAQPSEPAPSPPLPPPYRRHAQRRLPAPVPAAAMSRRRAGWSGPDRAAASARNLLRRAAEGVRRGGLPAPDSSSRAGAVPSRPQPPTAASTTRDAAGRAPPRRDQERPPPAEPRGDRAQGRSETEGRPPVQTRSRK